MAAQNATAGLTLKATAVWRLSVYVTRNFFTSHLPDVAATLTFTSLVALAPAISLIFATIAIFPQFDPFERAIENFVFDNFLPHTGGAVREYLAHFRANIAQISVVGAILLASTCITLLLTIERVMNQVFMVERKRPALMRFLAFWTVFTLGPALMVLSISLSSAMIATSYGGGANMSAAMHVTGRLLPVLITLTVFTSLYRMMPNRPVALTDAFIGAGVAAVVFEILKYGFGLYVTIFSGLGAVYGALSALPILLLWMFCSWNVVLFGASITAVIPEWRTVSSKGSWASRSGRLTIGVEMLRRLRQAHLVGQSLSFNKITRGVGGAVPVMEDVMAALEKAGMIRPIQRNHWILGREIAGLSLYDVKCALGTQIQFSDDFVDPPRNLAPIMQRAAEAERQCFDVPLTEILDAPETAEARPKELPRPSAV